MSGSTRLAVLLCGAALVVAGCASSGGSSNNTAAAATTEVSAAELAAKAKENTADYRIGPNDLLEVSVLGVQDLAREVRVNSSGKISMPLIGLLNVEGLTADETERIIANAYEQDYLQDPQVSVFIKEFTSQRFTVDGAVRTPGVYPLTGRVTLLRALAIAGGKGELADLENVMIFRDNEQGETESSKFDVNKIRSGEAPDPVLERDDIVVVNRNQSRVTLRDSLFRDVLDTINPFSSSYRNVSGDR